MENRRMLRVTAAALAIGLAAGAARAQAPAPAGPVAPKGPAASADPELGLGHEVTLQEAVAVALRRNPDVAEVRERALAARARAAGAGRLPDAELEGELQNVPLSSPLSLRDAEMWMLGVRQSFPAFGARGARRRAGAADADVADESVRARERDVVAQTRRTFWEYYRADRSWRIRRETIELARRVADLARGGYESGRGSQQDVLRTAVEVARLETDLAADEQAVRSAQVLLNALMDRDQDAALGPPAEEPPHRLELGLDDLEEILARRRPELVAAQHAVRRGEASLDAARKASSRPEVMVGLRYGYFPGEEPAAAEPAAGDHATPVATESMDRHFYTVMLGMSLPWLNPGRGADVREAERAVAADRRALDSVRNAARFQLRDAMARYHAARISFDALDGDILPKARQSFESAQSAFGAVRADALGLLDALRSYLAVRLERARALAALEIALADVERALGEDLVTRGPAGESSR
jgi:outer membrane protein TolC